MFTLRGLSRSTCNIKSIPLVWYLGASSIGSSGERIRVKGDIPQGTVRSKI